MPTKIEWAEDDKKRKPVMRKDGYVLVYCPSYPGAKPNGYVFEHRLVTARKIGRPLKPTEVVHHINGNRADNRIENLILKTNSRHTREHIKKIPKEELRKRAAKTLVLHAMAIRKPRVIISCACGCGKEFETPDKKGRDRQYIQGHNSRGKSWRWKR